MRHRAPPRPCIAEGAAARIFQLISTVKHLRKSHLPVLSIVTILAAMLTFDLGATPAADQGEPRDDQGGVPGGAPDGELHVALGDCLGVEIEVGASCGVLTGAAAALECDPLSVEAGCIAELGPDCGGEAFAACTAALTAHCEAEVQAGGALFCGGTFIGADTCLGQIDVDVDIDAEACVDVDLGGDVDLDRGVCRDLGPGLGAQCHVSLGAQCHAKCDPAAARAACAAELGGGDDELHAFAACQAAAIVQCDADCDGDGALFCEGSSYAGAGLCKTVGRGIGVDF